MIFYLMLFIAFQLEFEGQRIRYLWKSICNVDQGFLPALSRCARTLVPYKRCHVHSCCDTRVNLQLFVAHAVLPVTSAFPARVSTYMSQGCRLALNFFETCLASR